MRLVADAHRRYHLTQPTMARPAIVSLLEEFWAFLRARKKWWLAPIIIVLALFGSLIVFTQGSALAPFIYTVF